MHTILQYFENAADKYPHHIALQEGDIAISYRQLNERSNQITRFLQKQSVSANDKVAIAVKNGYDFISIILATLKIGAVYMPVAGDFPAERIAYMLENAAPKIFITSRSYHHLDGLATSFVFEDHLPDINSFEKTNLSLSERGDFIYILYTSGSTGKPKGVLMRQEALSNLIDWQIKTSVLEAGSRTLQFSPLTFDVSFQEIFATLAIGGTLYIIDDRLRLDSAELLEFITHHQINRIFLPFVAFQALCDMAEATGIYPSHLKEIMTAGEVLKITPQIRAFYTNIKDVLLYNQYGPTETHVVTSLTLGGDPAAWSLLPNIGYPLPNVDIYLLNENLQEVPQGETGELCIGGLALSQGYVNQPTLTAEKFIEWEHPVKGKTRLYTTGDLAKQLPDGAIEFIGRKDEQLKIRGFRVELAEIETCLLRTTEQLADAVVAARGEDAYSRKIIAYLVAKGGERNTEKIKEHLQKFLPDYMIPAAFVWVDSLPKTTSGKVDKKALPLPDIAATVQHEYIKPEEGMENLLSELWKHVLQVSKVGAYDNFFELGGTSLLALKMAALLRTQHSLQLPVVKLYQYPKLRDLAEFMDGKKTNTGKIAAQQKPSNDEIAVIGMSGRFPGADTIDEFWHLLTEGKETITFFKNEELDTSISDALKNNPEYIKARGILTDVKKFDPQFFGISPKLAALMDPQQRVFLEIAWEALEQSGYSKNESGKKIGVFTGVHFNTYYTHNVLSHPSLIENAGNMQVVTLNDKDYVASRTSYCFDLKGPAVNVQSACSTSLVAIAQAVQSIRNGQCEMALAGGAAITVPVNSGHLYEEGAMLSKDGHCRPFDADAKGTLFSDGAGVVLLKTKEQALKDGDAIYVVIKGIGLSNDGGGKGSFTAPSAEGQATAISMAIEDAGIAPEDIGYIEAHGTATPLGDPIEIDGLNMAFGEPYKKQYCAIGSVKSNFGHLTIASGVTGFIKTCLSLHYKKLLPSINYKTPNPHIDFENTPFYVNNKLQDWNSEKQRIAGVSSFGVGGTNAHIIIAENDPVSSSVSSAPSRSAQLICWSAKSEKSVTDYAKKLNDYFQGNDLSHIADTAYTLHTARKEFDHKSFAIASSKEDFIQQFKEGSLITYKQHTLHHKHKLVFLFPGQGDQYTNMCRSLYEVEKEFRNAVDECAEILKDEMQEDIREVIYPKTANEEAIKKITLTKYSQPALFIIGYALGKLWQKWGIMPDAFAGHSIGEFVAAHFAGIISLKDALKIIVARGRMMNDLPRGSMLSVRLSQEKIQPYLSPEVELAAVNSPQLCVVAGTDEAINTLCKQLDEEGIVNKILATSHAFHSYMMDEVVAPFEKILQQIPLSKPQLPVASSVTGKWLSDDEAMSATYWAQHLRKPVLFSNAVQHLIDDGHTLFLELGPGKSVATLTRQQAGKTPVVALSSIEKEENQSASQKAILRTLGQLWINGVTPDWKAFYEEETRKKITDLPTYAFDRKEYWVNAAPKNNIHTELKNTEETEDNVISTISSVPASPKEKVIEKIKGILEDASGLDMDNVTPAMSFIEAGLDSLALTQVALLLKKQFATSVTFRQLNDPLGTIELLADHLLQYLPKETGALQKGKQAVKFTELSKEESEEIQKPFGAIARIEKKSATLDEQQQAYLQGLIALYNEKTALSKEETQKDRSFMADPRVVSGFKPATKELAYPVIVKKSKGSRLWDIDGNEYIDALNGFGSNMLGYQPDFLTNALKEQIEKGYEIGPQHELAGEVCKMICEFTQSDRAALCNTGSEAVLGAMRIARTVTGRSLIVAFTGSYHGIIDEVIARSSKKQKTYPAAPGILPEAVQNMLFLDYGTEESLRIIEQRSEEIAAVLVEPVQSRRCDFQPIAFLKELREITKASASVLIFDEVISGFRFHTGGIQAMFDIKADIATYGKVVGGGMPIGAIAGKKEYMDALDGGWWQYGDDSMPEAGVTYFAGTFVRHPLALAAAKASLEHFRKEGAALQEKLNANGKYLADTLNALCKKLNVPLHIAQFGSLWRIHFLEEYPYTELFFVLMRYKGIHILEGFPCFLTTAHTQKDLDTIIKCFEESLRELKQLNLIPYYQHAVLNKNKLLNAPPVANARLGKDKDGNPAWFVEDTQQPGKFLRILTD